MMTQEQILNKLSQYKSKYSRLYNTRCADGYRMDEKNLVYSDKIKMTICLETGLVSNLLRNEKTLNWIGEVIYGQFTPEMVFTLTGETVNYEMLSKENLEKVLVKFGKVI